MASSIYGYTPLRQDVLAIRILSILPGSRLAALECRLEHAVLDDDLDYQCLSYTWGDPSKSDIIGINGHSFPVTINLLSALQTLREESRVVRIWIDAVCINQNDIDERNAQVRLMRTIYEKAETVIIWLGEEADNSTCAMQTINRIDRRWATYQLSSEKDNCTTPAFTNGALCAVDQLLQRPWWRRVWTIQESTCPNRTYFRCGSDQVDFLAIVAFSKFRLYRAITESLRDHFGTPDTRRFYRVEAMYLLRKKRAQSTSGIDLLELLDNSRTYESSDPRDKLFALSELAPNTEKWAVKINYSLPLHEVYIGFVYDFINSVQNLDVLGHCQIYSRDSCSWSSFKLPIPGLRCFMPKRALPSWVPDWTLELETTWFMKNKNQYTSCPYPQEKLYKAAASFPPSIRLSKCLETLFIRGVLVDEVFMLGRNFGSSVNTQTVEFWYSWVQENLGSRYITGESTRKAVSHTLVADLGVFQGNPVRGCATQWPIQDTVRKHDTASAELLRIRMALENRGMFISRQGYMGIARFDVEEGDRVCILHGGQVPIILSPIQTHYTFKGECYVHGLMDGETMRHPHVWQDFALR